MNGLTATKALVADWSNLPYEYDNSAVIIVVYTNGNTGTVHANTTSTLTSMSSKIQYVSNRHSVEVLLVHVYDN